MLGKWFCILLRLLLLLLLLSIYFFYHLLLLHSVDARCSCVACILCSHFRQSLLLECVNDPCVENVISDLLFPNIATSFSFRWKACTHQETLSFSGFRIVNINYNEVYKHCLFIVMYYDVQWSDYRRTFISLDSIHSHNILVGSVYSLKWLHIHSSIP